MNIILLLIGYNALFVLAAFAGLKAFSPFHWPDGLGPAFWFTLKQAVISAILSVTVGFLAAPGYARSGRFKSLLRWVFLLPNAMSPLLVVLCLLTTFNQFPFGLTGIVLGHVFLNGGLTTVWLGTRWSAFEARWMPVAATLGATQPMMVTRVILPQMIPQILNTLAVVFSLCLTSFAVPLILGGGPQYSTLEVLIYERIHVAADIPSALMVGLLQGVLQLVVFVAVLKTSPAKAETPRPLGKGARIGLWCLPLAGVVLISLIPLLNLAVTATSQLSALTDLLKSRELISAVVNSAVAALVVALVTFGVLTFLATTGWRSFAERLPALSGVAVGLAGVLLFKTLGHHSRWILIAALVWGQIAVIIFPVFRLSAPALGSLRNKFSNPALIMGASTGFSFKKIFLPLSANTCAAAAMLAACWSMGEFSVAAMVAPGAGTLATFIQGLLGAYRLELASAVSLFMLVFTVGAMMILELLPKVFSVRSNHGLG